MTKHMINTLLIVATIYIGLLFVVKHPIAMALINEDAKVKESEPVTVKVQPKIKTTAAVKQTIKSTKKEPKQLKGETIVGLTQRVELNSAESINAIWLKFQGMSHLQNHVRWDIAPIAVYAYYSNFSADFTQADLSLGYRQKDVEYGSDNLHQFNLPTTTAKKYGFNTDNTSASDSAWAAAYQFNNLVEEYWLDSQGNIQSQSAFVYQ